jgi:hypothetical protein
MNEQEKSKAQLISELTALRQRVAELDDALAWSRQEPQRNGNQLANGQAAENFGGYIGLSSTDFNFNGFSLGDMTEV